MPPDPVVHLIDDDDAVRDAVSTLLRVCGLQVRAYASAEAFLGSAPAEAPGCVVTDVQMPQMTGLELLERLGANRAVLPVIVMTGRAERSMAAEALRHGAVAFLDKPFAPEELLAAVHSAIAGAAPTA
ncbi:MAG: fixJ [Phenylobacterium sp.]|jgi:two-component system response regulator FixJ|nr:fixJ [Phenylobacterium sp.]